MRLGLSFGRSIFSESYDGFEAPAVVERCLRDGYHDHVYYRHKFVPNGRIVQCSPTCYHASSFLPQCDLARHLAH